MGKQQSRAVAPYPTQNEFYAWKFAAKQQTGIQTTMPSYEHADRSDLHRTVSRQHYSVNKQAFAEKHKAPHPHLLEERPLTASRSYGHGFFKPHEGTTSPSAAVEKNRCCPWF